MGSAVRSAKEMGIIPGGGSVLVYVTRPEFVDAVKEQLQTDDEKMGVDVVFKSLTSPIRQIATNAGDDPSEVLFNVRGKNFGFGYNAASRKFEDLLAAGVLDPAKVVINAVVNAASIAGMVLTTDAVVTEVPAKPASAEADGMGGGM